MAVVLTLYGKNYLEINCFVENFMFNLYKTILLKELDYLLSISMYHHVKISNS